MALHGEIRVNGKIIGEWQAKRRVPQGFTMTWTPTPDHVLAYDCIVNQHGTLEDNPPICWTGVVHHRFGDGALGLAAAVLRVATAQTIDTVRL